MSLTLLLWAVGTGAVAWLLTGLVRRYAISREMWDLPTARSSHQTPTPRGGGLSIALTTLGAVAVLAGLGEIGPRPALGLLGGGVVVAAIGWLDDRRSVPAPFRALCHFVAAILLVWSAGGLPSLRLGTAQVELGFGGGILAVVGVVWAVNLYNFMDGIDGLAGGQGVVAATFGCLLLGAGSTGLVEVAAIIAGASAGFLVWNWAPARVFMGDVGSGLLGFLFAALALFSETRGRGPLVSWLLVLGVFFFDATVTLIRRVSKGERWYAAHRSHAYQRAVQAGSSHARVTLVSLGLSAGLGGLGLLGAQRPELMPRLALLAGLILALCYRWVEARRPMGSAEGN